MTKEPRNLGIRLDPELTERLERFEKRTGVTAVTLGRNALAAALDYFESRGKITFPLHVIDEEMHGLNEKGGGYGGSAKPRCAAAPTLKTDYFVVTRKG